MRKYSLIFCLIFGCLLANSVAEFRSKRSILSTEFQHKHVKESTLKALQKKTREGVLRHLKELPEDAKKSLSESADHHYKKDSYPQLTAWDFLEFVRTGDRGHYEGKINKRNQRLAILTIGHLLDEIHAGNSSLYVDEIFNGAWMILEDSTWTWPAHLHHLPSPTEINIDLGAGEMAKQISWIKVLMAEKFDHIQGVKMNAKIDFELERRIFDPYLKRHWGWDGLDKANASVNNWNPWINGNILKAAIHSLHNETLFNRILERTLGSVDVFLSNYGDDGGCDEGPAYWRQAGGRLIEYIQSIVEVFPGSEEYFRKQKLLKDIADYSWKMRITGHWFVNFADSVPPILYPPSLVYAYGQLFDDETLKKYASFLLHERNLTTDLGSEAHDLNEFLNYIPVRKTLLELKPEAPEPSFVKLPDLQVIVGRSKSDAQNGQNALFFAGKMGTNYESHNHNDVGNFILFQNGSPVLIDVGVGTYTAQTFGPQRYSLFYMQSAYHNCPTINGFQQHQNVPYHATEVEIHEEFEDDKKTLKTIKLSGDLASAYPEEAQVKHWKRELLFNRTANQLKMVDDYTLKQHLKEHKLNFMTVSSMQINRTDSGLLLANDKVKMAMEFKWEKFDIEYETKSLESDHHLTNVWGNSVQRFSLIVKSDVAAELLYAKHTVIFKTL